jgi:rod shape-determining protein MreC
MRIKLHKKKRKILIWILVILSLTALFSWSSGILHRNPFGRVVLTVFSPVLKCTGFLRNSAENTGNTFFRGKYLAEKNKSLSEDLARSALKNAKLEKEIKLLKKLGHLENLVKVSFPEGKNLNKYEILPVHIISYSPNPWTKTILVDKGYKSGIKKEQTVISESGVVGVVKDVSSGIARIQLLTDQRSAVTIRIKESGDLGVVKGTGKSGTLELNTEGLGRRLRRNDHAVTAGLQRSLFPGRLLIGVVESVERDKHGRTTARVKPAADFTRLEIVFILKGSEKKKESDFEDYY